MKKHVKFSSNPFSNDDDEEDDSDDDSGRKDDHTERMEDGGFTIVAPENEGSKKGKGSDGVNTV